MNHKSIRNDRAEFNKMLSDSITVIPPFIRFGVTDLYFMDLPDTEKSREIDSFLRILPASVLHGTSFRVSAVVGAANSLSKTRFFILTP